MAPLRVLALPAFAALATAISYSDYVPSCGPPCISKAVDENTTCDSSDNKCICDLVYTIKRDGETCFRSGCSESDYGTLSSLSLL